MMIKMAFMIMIRSYHHYDHDGDDNETDMINGSDYNNQDPVRHNVNDAG